MDTVRFAPQLATDAELSAFVLTTIDPAAKLFQHLHAHSGGSSHRHGFTDSSPHQTPGAGRLRFPRLPIEGQPTSSARVQWAHSAATGALVATAANNHCPEAAGLLHAARLETVPDGHASLLAVGVPLDVLEAGDVATGRSQVGPRITAYTGQRAKPQETHHSAQLR